MFTHQPEPLANTPEVAAARAAMIGFMTPRTSAFYQFAERGIITNALQSALAAESRWFTARPHCAETVETLTAIRKVVDEHVHEQLWCHNSHDCLRCAREAAEFESWMRSRA